MPASCQEHSSQAPAYLQRACCPHFIQGVFENFVGKIGKASLLHQVRSCAVERRDSA